MSFDRLAPFYLWMERLAAGGKMQRCRLRFLPDIPAPRRALLAGEGHGRFLPALLHRFPEVRVTVLDASAGMLSQAEKALIREGVGAGRVDFRVADILSWQPEEEGSFDLITTHFFLDCFPPREVEAVVAKLAIAAAPESSWLLADFFIPSGRGASRLRSQAILALLYAFFRRATGIRAAFLAAPDLALQKSGFTLLHEEIQDWGLLRSQWWTRS